MPTVAALLAQLKAQARPDQLAGMARYGMNVEKRLGLSMPALRRLAQAAGRDHAAALRLWRTGYAEARIVASLIADPQALTAAQMEAWVRDFDSWDVCDQVCQNLFEQSPLADRKIRVWSRRRAEFVRRAAFALIACLAWHAPDLPDEVFLGYLSLIERAAGDERNFVKKSVNWALRNIGKRNRALNRAAVRTARALQRSDARAARWIGTDALRELTSPAVQARLGRRRSA